MGFGENGSNALDSLRDSVPFFDYIIVAIAAAVLFFIVAGILGSETLSEVTVTVKDIEGNPVRGAELMVSSGGFEADAFTNSRGEASFSAPLGKDAEVIISKENYGDKKIVFVVKEGMALEAVLEDPLFVSKSIAVSFAGPDGKKLAGKEVKARFTCSTGMEFPEQEYTTENGEITIEIPAGCGAVHMTASASGMETISGEAILGKGMIFRFEALDVPLGEVKFRVKDLDTNRLVDGIRVRLIGEQGFIQGEKYTEFGEALFAEIPAGNYSAALSDPNADYAVQKIEFSIAGNERVLETIYVSMDLKIRVKVIAERQGTGERIRNARITLFDSWGSVVAEEQTNENGEALFPIRDNAVFYYSAFKSGYIPSEKIPFSTEDYEKGSEPELIAEMELCSDETCGALETRVLDEEGLPVENAEVFLTDREGNVKTEYGVLITDFNGFTELFTGIRAGEYVARARKYPSEARLDFEVKPYSRNFAELKMEIGSGSVSILAIDEKGMPVSSVEAELFTDYGESLGAVMLDSLGIGFIDDIKADKAVYVSISREGYMAYNSEPKQLLKGETTVFEAVLEKEVYGERPVVELRGVFAEDGSEAEIMEAGKTYTAKFTITVPANLSPDELGLFVRAGEEETMEEDYLFISKAEAPNATAEKGIYFSPPTGGSALVSGNAKWVSLVWDSPETGKYSAAMEITVNGTAPRGTYLPIFYRAWVREGSEYLRAPVDNELGTKESSAEKSRLYAQSYEKGFYEGTERLCYTGFCFGYSVLDVKKGEYLEKPFDTNKLSQYLIEFTITNNSKTDYADASLGILSTNNGEDAGEDISINSYSIKAPEGGTKESEEPVFKTGQIGIGEFRANRAVKGTLEAEPKTNAISYLLFMVESENGEEFSESIKLNSYLKTKIGLEATPAEMVAYVPGALRVKVFENRGTTTRHIIAGAKVMLVKIAPDKSRTSMAATTDEEGFAELDIPAASPGTRYLISADFNGLLSDTIEVRTRKEIAEFSPEKIDVFINSNQGEKTTEFSCILAAQTELVLSKLRLSGTFKGMVDETQMDGFLRQFEGTTLNSLARTNMRLITMLTEKAEKISEPVALNGAITVELTLAQNPEHRWLTEIPLKITVNPAGAQSRQGGICTSTPLDSWEASTLNGMAVLETSLKKECHDNNISATIAWNAEQTGQVELAITNSGTGKTTRKVLKEGEWISFDTNNQKNSYDAKLIFVANAGTDGGRAEFTVKIGDEKRHAGIDAGIEIINLENCIRTSAGQGAGKILDMGTQDSAQLTIDAAQCPDQEIEIRLCNGNPDCAGGTTGGITLSKTQLTLRQNTETIKISRQNTPGIYGINIQAKTQNTQWTNIGETLVAIQPQNTQTKPNNPFENGTHEYKPAFFSGAGTYLHSGPALILSRYNYSLVGEGTEDTATLLNRHLSEAIDVKADSCEWAEASKNDRVSYFDMENAGLGACAAGIMSAKSNMVSSQSAANEAGMETGASVKNSSIQAKEAVSQANDTSSEANTLVQKGVMLEISQQELESETSDAKDDVQNKVVSAANAVQQHCTTSSAGSKARTAENSAGGLKDDAKNETGKVVKLVIATTGDVQSTANSASNQMNQSKSTLDRARDTAAPTLGENIATNCDLAQPLFESAQDSAESSTGNIGEVIWKIKQELENSLKGLDMALENVGDKKEEVTEDISDVKDAIENSTGTGAAGADCETAKGVNKNQVDKAKDGVDKDVGDAIDDEKDKMGEVEAQAGTTQGIAEGAEKQGEKYIDAIDNPEDGATHYCGVLTQTAQATENANKFNWGVYGEILAAYPSMGFISGGKAGGLFADDEEDPCDREVTLTLRDWVINLAPGGTGGDALPLSADAESITPRWDFTNNKTIGQFDLQEVGVSLKNEGVKDTEKDAVYTTLTIDATRHEHDGFTVIKGSGLFGQFNVPDETTSVESMDYHLRLKTSEQQTLTTGTGYNAEACTVQNRAGYTGPLAAPRVKLDWNWEYFKDYPCDEANADYIYCDATQFNMELNYKLNVLRKFLGENHDFLQCPSNPADVIVADLTEDLEALDYYEGREARDCWLPKSTVLVDGRPALDYYIEANEGSIVWLPEENINNRQDLIDLLNFNAYLIKDGYSADFLNDFEEYSTDTAFFDPPEFFISTKGFGEYYKKSRISFRRKHSAKQDYLSGPGLYGVHMRVDFKDEWDFFEKRASANIAIELEFLEEPELDSPFYSMPFNGLVGTERNRYERQDYGVSYFVDGNYALQVNNNAAPTIGYESTDLNAIIDINAVIKTDFYSLNTSPETRGMLLSIGNPVNGEVKMVFQPSRATPVVMKVVNGEKKSEPMSVFYQILESRVAVNVGATANYWSAIGNCMDFGGEPLSEVFWERQDRDSNEKDILLDWDNLYVIDWEEPKETGEVYLKTIFYTNPKNDTTLNAYKSPDGMEFITSDDSGDTIGLNGVSGMHYNNFAGGTAGTIDSIEDVLELVREGKVCVTETSSATQYWWNPEKIYSHKGVERSIKEFGETEAESACIK